MTIKNIRDLSLSFFLIVCGFALLFGLFWSRPILLSLSSMAGSQHRSSEVKKMSEFVIPSLDVKITNLQIKYRNGYLLYKGNIMTTSSQKGDKKKKDSKKDFDYLRCVFSGESSHIEILLTDKDGFKVASIFLERRDLIQVVDNKGNPIYFSFEGKKRISYEDFAVINNYTIEWHLRKCKK